VKFTDKYRKENRKNYKRSAKFDRRQLNCSTE